MKVGDKVEVLDEGLATLRRLCPGMPPNHHGVVDRILDNGDQSDEAIKKAKDAISDATERSSCPTCKGSTENMPCKMCNNVGMVQLKPSIL